MFLTPSKLSKIPANLVCHLQDQCFKIGHVQNILCSIVNPLLNNTKFKLKTRSVCETLMAQKTDVLEKHDLSI